MMAVILERVENIVGATAFPIFSYNVFKIFLLRFVKIQLFGKLYQMKEM